MKYLDYHECAPYCLAKLPEDLRKQIVNDLAVREEMEKTSSVAGAYARRGFLQDHARWILKIAAMLRDAGQLNHFAYLWAKTYAECYYALYERWSGRNEWVSYAFPAWPIKPKWYQFKLRYWYEKTKNLGKAVIDFEQDPFVEVRAEIADVEKTIAKWAVPPREKVE